MYRILRLLVCSSLIFTCKIFSMESTNINLQRDLAFENRAKFGSTYCKSDNGYCCYRNYSARIACPIDPVTGCVVGICGNNADNIKCDAVPFCNL